MRKLGFQRWMVLLALLTVLVATSLLTSHTVRRAIYLRAHADEPIRPWMNVDYVARAHGVPRESLYQALGIELPAGWDKRPISVLARTQKRTIKEEIGILQAAVDRATGTPPSVPLKGDTGTPPSPKPSSAP